MTWVFPRAAVTSALVLFPSAMAFSASLAEILARSGAAVVVVSDDSPSPAHPATQTQIAYTTPARTGVVNEPPWLSAQRRAPLRVGGPCRRPCIQIRSGCHPASSDRPAAENRCDRAEPGSRKRKGPPLTLDERSLLRIARRQTKS